jgi:hypothetical protein
MLYEIAKDATLSVSEKKKLIDSIYIILHKNYRYKECYAMDQSR